MTAEVSPLMPTPLFWALRRRRDPEFLGFPEVLAQAPCNTICTYLYSFSLPREHNDWKKLFSNQHLLIQIKHDATGSL